MAVTLFSFPPFAAALLLTIALFLPVTVSVVNADTPLERPSGLRATQNIQAVTLNWKASTDSRVNNYALIRRNKTEKSDYSTLASGLGRITRHLDSSVVPGNTYVYRVVAQGDQKTSKASRPVTVKVPLPDKPTDIKLKASGSEITIYWIGPSIYDYEVLRKTNDPKTHWSTVATVPGDSYSDRDVSDDTEYFYRVKAVHKGVTGPVSSMVSITFTARDSQPRIPRTPTLIVTTQTLTLAGLEAIRINFRFHYTGQIPVNHYQIYRKYIDARGRPYYSRWTSETENPFHSLNVVHSTLTTHTYAGKVCTDATTDVCSEMSNDVTVSW